MGRIRFITVRIALSETGYQIRLSVHSDVEVIHREQYDRLTWREAMQVSDAVTDAYRPGLELMNGGVQLDLF
jgi:hypothetical protein